MSEYVFVYAGTGSGPNSREDLKELFTNYGIYADPNVCFSELRENFTGLDPKQMTIVLPGGSVSDMGGALQPLQPQLKSLFTQGCKGVFVCAGAYLACSNTDLFRDNYCFNSTTQQFDPLKYAYSTVNDPSRGDISLKLVDDYQAYGTFIPNNSYQSYSGPLHASMYKPYQVKLNWQTTECTSSQLFLGGCGFQSLNTRSSTEDIVATYADSQKYSFFYPQTGSTKTLSSLPAIVKKPGLLLSGPHIEACVDNSRFFKRVKEGEGRLLSLPASGVPYDPQVAKEMIIPLLQTTLTV